MSKLSGITYYQVPQGQGYEGDVYNDNKGLTGKQIDNNFLFLRGFDFKDIRFEESGDTLVFERLNGEKIKIEHFLNMFDISQSAYDKETGELIIKVGEQEKKLEGLNNIDYKNSSYDKKRGILTLDINGFLYHIGGFFVPPKFFDSTTLPGTYTPIKKVLGFNEALPNIKDAGDAYITQIKNKFKGKKYNLDALLALENYLTLTESRWHIPSFEEWNNMLNTIEEKICGTIENPHGGMENEVFQGKYAGLLLRDKGWYNPEWEHFTENNYNFNAQAFTNATFVTFWGGKDENGDYRTKSIYDIEENKNYAKIFQNKALENELYPIRLVKDTNMKVNGYEKIIDKWYRACVMPTDDITSTWMSENLNVDADFLRGYAVEGHENILVEEISNEERIEYLINKWNGYRWDEQRLKEGETFHLLDKINGRYEEFILADGNLVMIFQTLYDKIEEIIEKFNEYYTKIEIDEKLTHYYTKDQVNGLLEELNRKFDNYYTKEEVDEKIKKAGRVQDVRVKTNETGEYKTVVDQQGIAKIDLSNAVGKAYIEKDIFDKNGNVLLQKGITLTNAVEILTNTINYSDDDIGITYDEQGKNPRLRINGISN